MTRPERDFSLILEAQKRAGEIARCEFEGIRLKWGVDPDTGAAMWYKPDFLVVVLPTLNVQNGETIVDAINKHGMAEERFSTGIKVIEVKGPWISERDLVRFKGCRAAWPEFDFEMHQRDREGQWTRIL
jgi:hypothetical protein